MPVIWQDFRSGAWLTEARGRGYGLILLICAAAGLIAWIALSDGLVDRNGKPLGTDFSSFYSAGRLALDGAAASAYDAAAHHAAEQRMFGAATPYFSWLYPPIFFLLAAPLATLPYPLALAVWQGLTFAFYLAVIAAILRRTRSENPAIGRSWLVLATAFPAVLINLGHGQNGFLSAGLFGAALLSLPQRPVIAGMLFAGLAYKPQLALVLPFALLAAGQWRAIAAGVITTIALVGLSLLAFGVAAWSSFIASTELSRKLLLEEGSVGFEKLQSVFATVRLWGGSVGLAYTTQGVATLIVISATARAWSLKPSRQMQAALLLAATMLASPHVLDYDLMLLAPALAFFVADRSLSRWRSYEISLLAAVWAAPLFARLAAGLFGLPLGLLANTAFFAVILREVGGRQAGAGAPTPLVQSVAGS